MRKPASVANRFAIAHCIATSGAFSSIARAASRTSAPRGAQLGRHVGEREDDRLLLGERLAEREALVHVAARARSSAHCAPPSEHAAMLMRPPLSADIAILKPWPCAPSMADAGTRTSSRITWRVGCAFQPIFFSFGPNVRPAASPGTRNARDAARAGLAGARHDDVDRGLAAAGDELLDAGQHVVVAVADRAGRDGGGIRPGARLGEAVAAEVRHRGEPRQPGRDAAPRCRSVSIIQATMLWIEM